MNNSLNLQEINQEQSLSLCKFNIQTNGNIFLLGRRGTGKTEIANQAINQLKLKTNYVNLSLLDRSDLFGYPNMHEPGDFVTFKAPVFMRTIKKGEKADTVILFDEVDKAPPEVTAPLLEILQFRTVNGRPINAVACILTGNLANEGAYSNQISTALLDRGSKYIISFDFDKWLSWGRDNNVHELILGFLKSNQEFACGKENDISYASPSPRGWTLASEALIKARAAKLVDIDTITNIISGYVGLEAGLRFKMWYEHFRKFEPFIHTLIETGEMSLNFSGLVPTEKLIFTISLCGYTRAKLAATKPSQASFKYLENMCRFMFTYKVDKEVQTIAMSNAFNFNFITSHKLYQCKPFFELFNELSLALDKK